MNKKLILALLTVLALLGGLVTACASPAVAPQPKPAPAPAPAAAPQPIKLAFASIFDDKYSNNRVNKWWMDEITKRTNGKIQWQTYWSGTLLNATDIYPGTGKGLVDVSLSVPAGYNPNLVPLMRVGNNTYITDKPDAGVKAMADLYKMYPQIDQEFVKNNVKHFFYTPGAPNIIGTKTPVRTIAELKGIKIRTAGMPAKIMEKWGAVPVSLAWGEIYDALQKGVVQAFGSAVWDLAIISKLHEVAPYFSEPGYGIITYMTTSMNLEKWNSLPDDVKKVFEAITPEIPGRVTQDFMASDAEQLKPAKDGGVKAVFWSDEEKQKGRNMVIPGIWEEWVKEVEGMGYPGSELLQKYGTLVAQYEASSTFVTPIRLYAKLYGSY